MSGFCSVGMNNSDCVDPLTSANGTRVGKIRTKCYACGEYACTRDSRSVKGRETTGFPTNIRTWLGKRVCNDCRSNVGLPMVGTDYGTEDAK